MKQKSLFPCVFLLMFVFVSFLTSCGTKEEENTVSPDTKRITNLSSDRSHRYSYF